MDRVRLHEPFFDWGHFDRFVRVSNAFGPEPNPVFENGETGLRSWEPDTDLADTGARTDSILDRISAMSWTRRPWSPVGASTGKVEPWRTLDIRAARWS